MITSLGTALLDEFEWLAPDGTPTRPREVRWGGGGTYAIIGARVWTTAVGQLVHRGPDFPAAIEPQLDRFGPIWHFHRTEEPTPRMRVQTLARGDGQELTARRHRHGRPSTPTARRRPPARSAT
ncbi:hypothetical protein JCM21900_006445 [Sporobolomyces salmonicolor]